MHDIRGAIPSHLRARLKRQRALDAVLAQCIPADWKLHCTAAVLQSGELVIVVDSPAWRSRIHLHSEQIINHFNRLDNLFVERVKVRCAPVRAPGRLEARRPARPNLPPEAARDLASLAGTIDDRELSGVLERLARHGTGHRDP